MLRWLEPASAGYTNLLAMHDNGNFEGDSLDMPPPIYLSSVNTGMENIHLCDSRLSPLANPLLNQDVNP